MLAQAKQMGMLKDLRSSEGYLPGLGFLFVFDSVMGMNPSPWHFTHRPVPWHCTHGTQSVRRAVPPHARHLPLPTDTPVGALGTASLQSGQVDSIGARTATSVPKETKELPAGCYAVV
jgi:hypothetical protein